MLKIHVFTKWLIKLLLCIRCDNSTTKSNNQQQQQQLCEGDSSNEAITSVPVVLKTNQNIIFRNIFCAFCHGYKLKDLETKEFYYECEANVSFTSQEEIKSGIEQNLCTLKAKRSDAMIEIMFTPTPKDLLGCSTSSRKIQQNFSFGCLFSLTYSFLTNQISCHQKNQSKYDTNSIIRPEELTQNKDRNNTLNIFLFKMGASILVCFYIRLVGWLAGWLKNFPFKHFQLSY